MRAAWGIAIGLSVVGCSNEPFEAGAWTITAASESNDTCGRSPAEQGIGTPVSATFAWGDAKALEVTGFGKDSTWDYDAFELSWSAGWDEAYEVGPACEQTETHTLVLTSDAPEDVLIDATVGVGVRGDGCGSVDTEGPCSFELRYIGAYTGE